MNSRTPQDVRAEMNVTRMDYSHGKLTGDEYTEKMNKLSDELAKSQPEMKVGIVK